MFFAASTPVRRPFDAARAGAASAPGSGVAWTQRDVEFLGSPISVELWSEDAEVGAAAAAAAVEETQRIARALNPHEPDSELARINRDAGAGTVPLSDRMACLIERAMHFSHLSGGAFDITHASGAAAGWRYLELDPRARTLRFGHPRLRVDLGGFAKGHAVDCAAAILRRHGVRHAIVAAGGGSRVIGRCDGWPWTAAIPAAGDAGRCTERGGARRRRIVDPSTGRSPDSVRSVTIVGPDGLSCEALSKSVFVLGVESGLQLVESLAGFGAVIVDAQGREHRSAGLPEVRDDG